MFIHIGGVNVHLRTRLQVRHRSYKADIGLSARPARQILSRSFVMSGKHVGNGERCLGAMLCGNALSTTLLKRTYVTCQVDGR